MSNTEQLHYQLAHIGMNCRDEEEARETADLLQKLFGWEQKETEGSIFAGDGFEIMKHPFLGRLGHAAILCDDAAQARKQLEERGVEFDDETAGYTEDGRLNTIYFRHDIAGFRFHLKQR